VGNGCELSLSLLFQGDTSIDREVNGVQGRVHHLDSLGRERGIVVVVVNTGAAHFVEEFLLGMKICGG
jgi:hypothetical protein